MCIRDRYKAWAHGRYRALSLVRAQGVICGFAHDELIAPKTIVCKLPMSQNHRVCWVQG